MSLTKVSRSVAIVVLALLLMAVSANGTEEKFSPEELYKKTIETWQRKSSRGSSTSWEIWKDFAKTITLQYETIIGKDGSATTTDTEPGAVEIVGAIEEGILTIERIVFQQQESSSRNNAADDQARDAALAIMYQEYGRLLIYSSTSPIASQTHRCYELAKDPHTLLIGAPERVNEYFKTRKKVDDENALLESLFGPLCKDNAENALRNAVSLDASCREAQTLLDEIISDTRKPKEFVAELFDSFADTFDEKLTKTLEYRVPQIIGSKVAEILEKEKLAVHHVLDAGCGTGLAGRELRQAIDGSNKRITLVGVDASPKMLEIAKHCTETKGCGLSMDAASEKNDPKLYDALIDLDLEEMTIKNTLLPTRKASGFDLIVAADVFVYFGSLERVLKVFSGLHKDQKGILVFSCERATAEQAPLGYKLMPTGRFAHTKEHVQDAASASGYSLLDYSEIVPRTEKGVAVDGQLFVFAHSATNDEGEL